MKKSVAVVLFLFLGLFIGTSWAFETTRFGPNKYMRMSGQPNIFIDTFSATVGEGKLIVINGDESGNNRVSSASVTINNVEIISPNNFNQKFEFLEIPISLSESNSISIRLTSSPLSYITLKIMQEIPLDVSIVSPLDGEIISGPDVMVKGTIINPANNEIGINANGIVALVCDNQFVANHVPLQDGENIINVTLTDIDGNTLTKSVTVNKSVLEENYLRITAVSESGVSPLEATLKIEGSFGFADSSLTITGPDQVTILDHPGPEEYTVQMTAEGIYFFTAEANDALDTAYGDTVAVAVYNKEEIDALLRSKWESMKSALINQEIEKALQYFADDNRELYREIYTDLGSNLPQIINEMNDIQVIVVEDGIAKYRIRKNELHKGDVYPITYYIYFIQDNDGLWRLYRY
jgi:hypothetical protein